MEYSDDNRPIYHVSDLSKFEACGYAWYQEREQGRRRLGTFYTARGTGAHKAREFNLRQKVTTHRDLELDMMLDAARDKIVSLVTDDLLNLKTERLAGLGKKAAAGRIIDATVPMVRLDRQNLQSRLQPVEVEVKVQVHLPQWPFDLGMTIDSIDIDNYDTDFKTTMRRWSQQKAEDAYSPKIYKLGFRAHRPGEPFAGFRFHIVTCTKKLMRVSAYELTVNPDNRATRAVLERFAAMHRSIQTGTFNPCEKGHWRCSPEHCGLYINCKYV